MKKYDPNQPRDPKGTDTGGQWTAKQLSLFDAALRKGAGLPATQAPATTQAPTSNDFIQTPKLASEISGVVPTINGVPVPVTTSKGYHVTTRENAEKILKEGFDLEKVKPRWLNDRAVSLSKGRKKDAVTYMANDFDSWKKRDLVLLEVTTKGRSFDQYDRDAGLFFENKSSPQAYTKSIIDAGWDAFNFRYIYNPKAITKIHLVSDDEIKEIWK